MAHSHRYDPTELNVKAAHKPAESTVTLNMTTSDKFPQVGRRIREGSQIDPYTMVAGSELVVGEA